MRKTQAAKWLLLVLLLLPSAARSAEPVVSEVQIRGLFRVEAESMLQKLKTRAGQTYQPEVVGEDVRTLFSTGYFRDVKADLSDDGRVTFLVVERPAVNDWRVEGSTEVEKEDLAKAIPVKKKEILDAGRVEDGARAVRDLFRDKGFYLAEVTWQAVPLADGKNQVDVVYQVKEGAKVQVKDLHLLGASRKEDKAVRDYMATTQVGFWSWLTSSGTFKENELDRDKEVIRSYYLNNGYAEVKVLEPRVSLTSDRKWIKIDIPIQEGDKFRIGKVKISGDLEYPVEKLKKDSGLVEGELFRSDDLRKAIQVLSDLYADLGFAFADVDPDTHLDRTARTLSVDFQIKKGDRVRIGRVEIRGNTKTRDRVIRREVRLAEGEIFSATAIRRSREKIEALGFFEKVNLKTNRRPGTALVDVDIEVEEKATGSFTVGAGYSSTDKIVGMASVSQRNLLGLGYQLSLSANLGTGATRKTYSVTFNNPRVNDSDVYAGFDIYNSAYSYTDYEKDSSGGALKLGRALGEDWRIRWIYRYDDSNISEVAYDASQELKDAEGTTITSAISQIVAYDTRDNPWEPSRGAQSALTIEWAGGVLGGDAAYIKYDLDASKYYRLWWKHVLTLHAQMGYIYELASDGVPIFTKYTLGGINSVRGFPSQSIGPREKPTGVADGVTIPEDEWDVVGGNKMLLLNVEYVFPLIEEAKLKGVVFFDAGNAWSIGHTYLSTGLRTGAGLGIRWFSPMGPLRLEYGWNLRPSEKYGEDRSKWEFSIGGFF
ncbi:MAG: outer membrane protein assembly factor BamA [Deltaproteobacteria bacterium]|nr:outer membrane protein assembly factor BamA [Deltaproteobacteria bacterium]